MQVIEDDLRNTLNEAKSILELQSLPKDEESEVERLTLELFKTQDDLKQEQESNENLRSIIDSYKTEKQQKTDTDALEINAKYLALDMSVLSGEVAQKITADIFDVMIIGAKNLTREQKIKLTTELF